MEAGGPRIPTARESMKMDCQETDTRKPRGVQEVERVYIFSILRKEVQKYPFTGIENRE
jgi:hypothetical protein